MMADAYPLHRPGGNDGESSRLLVVHHSPTRSMRALIEAVLAGAGDEDIEGVEVVVRPALEATAEDVLAADGYLLATPGQLRLHERRAQALLRLDVPGGGRRAVRRRLGGRRRSGGTAGRPFGLLVHGRYDTTGAVRSVQSIVGALGWRQSAEVLEVLGEVGDEETEAASELGATLAALLVLTACSRRPCAGRRSVSSASTPLVATGVLAPAAPPRWRGP